MKICFVLPRYSRRPIGGHKIVYEYANRLTERGYKVFLLFINDNTFVEYKIPKLLRPVTTNIMTQIEPRWFKLDKKIQKLSGLKRKDINILSRIDVCVATSVETVVPCKQYFPEAKKLYLIQDYEIWATSKDKVHQTYKEEFTNIVISNWLKQIVDIYANNPSLLIKNPIDLNIYKPIVPIEQRKTHTIGLLYHSGEHKGLKYSFEALKILKRRYPDLDVFMFGTSKLNEKVPGLKKYIRDASTIDTVKIYNSVSVFMCSSINEGYGLTGMEAMACGAALATTEYSAVYEYAIKQENALLSPVKDPGAMVRNICRLFDDENERYRIAKNGVCSLEKFSWDIAITKFVSAMEQR
jgi:glycosyltransferase involved in cell wall biosynthesis